MKATLVKVGNSRGVRIPKALIEQCGFGHEVEITAKGRTLVISPVGGVREGWDDAFKRMAESGDDGPLLPDGIDAPSDWQW